ncbi:MAG: glycosyltransferase [Candidatus Bathyarchaeia archaeon]
MSLKPRVSVIIPAFKEERYIGRLLKNVLNLKPRAEVIVVISGESDRTAEVARQYLDNVFVIDEYGISVARNYGARVSNGDILLFIDADVTLPEDTMETLIKTFRDEEVVGATCKIMPYKAKFCERAFFIFYNLLLRLTTFFKPHSRGEFLAVRRRPFFTVGGFNERMMCLEDHDLAIRLSKVGRFKFLDSLTIYESMRRFRKLGSMKVILIWLINYCSYLIKGKPIYSIWQPVR